jgi:hypothetical protein
MFTTCVCVCVCVYIYICRKSYESRNVKTSYNLGWIEYFISYADRKCKLSKPALTPKSIIWFWLTISIIIYISLNKKKKYSLLAQLNVYMHSMVHASVHRVSPGSLNHRCTWTNAKTTEISGQREYTIKLVFKVRSEIMFLILCCQSICKIFVLLVKVKNKVNFIQA